VQKEISSLQEEKKRNWTLSEQKEEGIIKMRS
jgi:hypothetical protein